MSGLADVTRVSGGMVEWGLSLARNPRRSAYRLNMSSKSRGQLLQGSHVSMCISPVRGPDWASVEDVMGGTPGTVT